MSVFFLLLFHVKHNKNKPWATEKHTGAYVYTCKEKKCSQYRYETISQIKCSTSLGTLNQWL